MLPAAGSLRATGGGKTVVIVKVCVVNVSSPPLAVPPSSLSTTETVALPEVVLLGV
ncbi:MAG: hypothetical protein AVDCRST_MAG85-3425 [uncultured Solirubrobacteraceae bacterium]|uniref:Uncharacterized protein n=1 Tax=uncultured Solirubrobacteraceae bacterium TaxID=1162706 RepID=A0A6J4TNG1_9ACTN|nr:MAG: hypothetical protein AVDCRST_MAG85-3425 [uncultured Solirubrobacteraceae bacterium]